MKVWLTLLFVLAAACVAAFSWQWIAADPGYLLIRYGDTSIETTLIFAIVALLLVAALIRLLWRSLRAPLAAWTRHRRRRSRERIADGLVALAEGRYAHAQRELERAAHLGALQGPALLGAARAAQARGDTARAHALLARAPAAAALVVKARFDLERDRPQAALDLLQQAAKESSLPPAGLQLLVDAALRCGDAPAALAALPGLARTQSLPPAALAALESRVFTAALASAPSRERLDALWSGMSKSQRRDVDAVIAYARRAAALGQLLAAMSELEAALRREWSERVVVCYGELGPAECEARLRHAEGWIAAHADSAGLALTLGRLCNDCKLWGKARDYLERGLEIAPSAALWEALGNCHAGRDDAGAAARCWQNALLAARGEATQPLPIAAAASTLSTRAAIREERSEHGVPRLPGQQGLGARG